MKFQRRLGVIVTAAVLWAFATPVAADFKAGVAAYKRSDYKVALREFSPLAKRGMARAQSNLGLMYSRGNGVKRNNAVAAMWYRLAAEQGLSVAQHNLAVLYSKGEGLPKDNILGLMWAYLADENGYKASKELVNTLEEQMKEDRVALARQFRELWTKKMSGQRKSKKKRKRK